jgi:hypothetical protein
MTEITRIMITLAPPKGSFPGKVAEGHYKVEGETVLLTDKAGTPVDRYRLTQKIKPGQDPKGIACSLLRSRYSGASDSFNRKLTYPRTGF